MSPEEEDLDGGGAGEEEPDAASSTVRPFLLLRYKRTSHQTPSPWRADTLPLTALSREALVEHTLWEPMFLSDEQEGFLRNLAD